MSRKAIIFLVIQENAQTAFYREYCDENKNHPKYEFIVTTSGEESANILSEYDGGVLFFSISNKPQMMDLLKFFQLAKMSIKKGLVKVSGYNNINNPKVVKYLKENGVQEIFEAPLSNRSISFKIDLWFKGIDFAIKKHNDSGESNNQVNLGNKKNKNAQNSGKLTKKASTGLIKYLPGLNLQSDCWLIENKTNLQFSMNNWIIELIGPGPAAGHWNDVSKQKNSEIPIWKWVPFRDEIFQFIVNDGHWIFQGREPMFNWETNKWKFIASRPFLYFETEKEKIIKFMGTSGQLEIAENSPFGKRKLSLIEESLDPKYNFSKNGEENSTESNTVGTEVIDTYLRGKNSDQDEASTAGVAKKSLGGENSRLSPLMGSSMAVGQEEISANDSLQEIQKQLQIESTKKAKNVPKSSDGADEKNTRRGRSDTNLVFTPAELASIAEEERMEARQRVEKNLHKSKGETLTNYYQGNNSLNEKGKTHLQSEVTSEQSDTEQLKKTAKKFQLQDDFSSEQLDGEFPEPEKIDEDDNDIEKEIELDNTQPFPLQKKAKISMSSLDDNIQEEQQDLDNDQNSNEKGNVLSLDRKQSIDRLSKVSNEDKKIKKEKKSLDLMEEVDDFLSTSEEISSFGSNDHENINSDIDLDTKKSNLPKKDQQFSDLDEISPWDGQSELKGKNSAKNAHRQHNDEMKDHLNEIEQRNKDWEKYLRGGSAKKDVEKEDDKWSGPSGNRNNFKNKGSQTSITSEGTSIETDATTGEKLKNYFSTNLVEKEDSKRDFQGIKIGKNIINTSPVQMDIALKTKNPQTQVFSDSFQVNIVDQFDDLIILSNLTGASLSTSMQVLIDCQINYKGKGLKFSMVGIVKSIDILDELPNQINIQLVNFNKDHLNALYDIFIERQHHIAAFMNAAKGIAG